MPESQYIYPRWSLRGWLLTIAFVALVGSHFYVSAQNRSLRMTNYLLKQRNGFPQNDDPSLIQAAEVPMPHPCQWRFRVVVPKGRRLELKVAYENVPYKGLPVETLTRQLSSRSDQPTEFLIDAYLFHEEGNAYLWCAFDDGHSSINRYQSRIKPIRLPQDHYLSSHLPRTSVKDWIAPTIVDGPMTRGKGSILIRGWDSTSESPGKPMVLLRWRSDGDTKDPGDGLMIWLEERKTGTVVPAINVTDPDS